MARCFSDGPTLKHYTYDGLGRLIRTQSPFPTPQHAALGEVRSERFYYDGIRRIQETRLDPSKNLGGAMLAGDPQVESAALASLQEAKAGTGDPAAAEIDLTAAPLTLENQLLAMADPGPGPGPGPDQPASPVQLVREYVWGPGDAWHPATVDELLCYYGEGREAYWPIQDSSGDVAAVCVPGTQANGYAARVAAQQRYDAYGQVISADHLLPHAFLAAGHKGLFYDRLDRGVSDGSARGSTIPPSSATTDTPRLVPFARGLYHVRNRTMLPGGGSHTAIGHESLTCANPPTCSTWALSQQGLSSGAAVHGRFMQADPNATGMVLVGMGWHGSFGMPRVDAFDLRTRFSDGPSLYVHLGGNPWGQSDPLGLFSASYAINGGFRLGSFAADLFGQYASNLANDADWARNWSADDRAYSRLDSRWIREISALHFNGLARDMVLGPIGTLIDAYELTESVAEYFANWLYGIDEYDDLDSGPAMAGIPGRLPFRNSLKAVGGHGSLRHKILMWQAFKKIRGFSVQISSIRMNQCLVDPVKKIKLSNLRPDVQGFKPPNTIYIVEAAVSQTPEAAKLKWTQAEIPRLKQMGYNVIIDVRRP